MALLLVVWIEETPGVTPCCAYVDRSGRRQGLRKQRIRETASGLPPSAKEEVV